MLPKALFIFFISIGLWVGVGIVPARGSSTETAGFRCSYWDRFPRFHLGSGINCRAWTFLETSQNEEVKICLSEPQWLAWVHRARPPVLCGDLAGQWKLSAWLEEEETETPKRVSRVYHLSQLPEGSRAQVSSIWTRFQLSRESLSQRLQPEDPWGVFRALLLGESDRNAPLGILRLLGFVHLLTASGVHLYAASFALSWLFGGIFGASRVPARIALPASRILTGSFWFWAWILSGCRAGMLRPGFVVIARATAKNFGFRWRYWTPLFLSLSLEVALCLTRGTSIFEEGRIDAALAVGGFLMAVENNEETSRFGQALSASIGGWIFVALYQASHLQIVSLAVPIVNLVSLPLFCTLAYPWFLIESALGWWTKFDVPFLHLLHQTLYLSIQPLLSLPWLWIVPKSTLLVSFGIAGVWVGFTARASGKTRVLAMIGVIALLAFFRHSSQFRLAPSKVGIANDVIQMDVGQGDAALVLGPTNGLIDAGSSQAVGDDQWIRMLARAGVSRLDWVALTHLDEDHRGGLERLPRLLAIGCVATSSQELHSERGQELSKKLLLRGVRLESWETGCVPFPVRPPHDSLKAQREKKNAHMSAILVPLVGGDYFLSAGDAEASDEIEITRWADQWIRKKDPEGQGRRIMKASHHGSRTSSAEESLHIFHPDVAVISAGLGNSYGHPSAEVLRRFSDLGIPIHRTDRDGPFRAEAFLRRPRERLP